jgi:hypothetical protein
MTLTVYDFLAKEGCLPRLGDPDPPWTLKGWALPYVQQIHERCPTIPDRWGYFLRTVDAGKLLDEPIPEIRFAEVHDPSVLRSIQKWTDIIGWD